jgi:hypothetical protein
MRAFENGELTLSLANLLKQLNSVDDLFHPEGIRLMLHVDGSGAIVTVSTDAVVFSFENTGELIQWMGSPAKRVCSEVAW